AGELGVAGGRTDGRRTAARHALRHGTRSRERDVPRWDGGPDRATPVQGGGRGRAGGHSVLLVEGRSDGPAAPRRHRGPVAGAGPGLAPPGGFLGAVPERVAPTPRSSPRHVAGCALRAAEPGRVGGSVGF